MSAFDFTPEQRKLIRDSFLSGATDAQAQMLIEIARVRRLDPLKRQIHFVNRYDSRANGGRGGYVWREQVGIDGFRSIAEETGEYDGQDEVEFTYGQSGDVPVSAKVRVYRKGISRPFVGVAHYREYVQVTKDGKVNSMWERGPHFMLAKCAEAVAFRRAFPLPLGGLYTPDEMGTLEDKPALEAPISAALPPGDEISTEVERDIATEAPEAIKSKSERLAAKWDNRPKGQLTLTPPVDDIPPPTDDDYRGR